MILALITSLALLFDDEREESNRTVNIVPGTTLISFFAASFSSAMPEPSGPAEEAGGAWPREVPGWATLGCGGDPAAKRPPQKWPKKSCKTTIRCCPSRIHDGFFAFRPLHPCTG